MHFYSLATYFFNLSYVAPAFMYIQFPPAQRYSELSDLLELNWVVFFRLSNYLSNTEAFHNSWQICWTACDKRECYWNRIIMTWFFKQIIILTFYIIKVNPLIKVELQKWYFSSNKLLTYFIIIFFLCLLRKPTAAKNVVNQHIISVITLIIYNSFSAVKC